MKGLGLEVPPTTPGEQAVGVAVFAVSGRGDAKALDGLQVRVWRGGRPVPDETSSLEPNEAGVAAVITDADELAPHWVSIEPKDAEPTVIAVPLLKDRLAAVVAQVDPDRVRIYQFHPLVPAGRVGDVGPIATGGAPAASTPRRTARRSEGDRDRRQGRGRRRPIRRVPGRLRLATPRRLRGTRRSR